jgi:hypothetical protein
MPNIAAWSQRRRLLRHPEELPSAPPEEAAVSGSVVLRNSLPFIPSVSTVASGGRRSAKKTTTYKRGSLEDRKRQGISKRSAA